MGLGSISYLRAGLAGLALAAVASCDAVAPQATTPSGARPAGLASQEPYVRSAASEDLARYYRAVQSDLLARGLLRTNGGGPDTPFDADDLVRNFEQIAFFDEYARGGSIGSGSAPGAGGRLSRWSGSIRIGVEFGTSVPPEQRMQDQQTVSAYAQRLARITGHSISSGRGNPNFHVFFAGEDDRDFVQKRLLQLVPNISQTELDLFQNLPRSFYCLVVAISGTRSPHNYTRAIALIRAEHPDLMRLSCVHEEIAQGLGLPNDSPAARPSIFNDDDEFALLTAHDEFLLQMLYDPRLKQGMTADEARPVVRIIAREMMGQEL